MRRLLFALAAACLALIIGLRGRVGRSLEAVASVSSTNEIPHGIPEISSPATRPFIGFVVDEKGRAIGSAKVCARVEGAFLADAERAAVCVRSSDDGRFTFTTPPMVLQLVASAAGYLPRTTLVQDLDHPASIVLARGGAKIAGKVLDPLGRPLANARIESDGATESITDRDGGYELWTAPGIATLRVSAEGYADQEIEGFAPSEGNDLKLEWGGTIVGRARPQAWVSASGEGTGEKSVRADESGAFRIAGLASGRYVVEARAPGNYGRFATVVLGVGEVSDEIEIPFEPARDVTVRFPACTSGRVMLVPERPRAVLTAAPLVLGSARVLSVKTGRYVVRLGCNDGVVTAPRTITVAESDLDLSFEPSEGVRVGGVVVADGSGAALPFATVVARSKDQVFAQTTADAKGAFHFAALPPARYVVTAEHPDALESSIALVVAGAVDDIRLELDVGGSLHGRTVDADGHPVSGLRIDAGGRISRSGVDGRFTLLHVPIGETTVVATRGAITLGSQTVTIERDGIATLEVVVEPENVTIEGRVEDENGAPIVEALVELGLSHGLPSMRASTDANGHFAFIHLADASYVVRASRRGRGTVVESVSDGETATLVLRPAASIVGTAAGASSSNVWLTCAPSTRESTLIRNDGTFVFEDLAAGSCTLDFGTGAAHEKRTIVLKTGEIARPSFQFD